MLQRGGGVAQAPSNNVTGGGSDLFCCIAASDAAFVQTHHSRHTDTFTQTQKDTDTYTHRVTVYIDNLSIDDWSPILRSSILSVSTIYIDDPTIV